MKISELGKYLKEYRIRNGLEIKEVQKIFLEDYQLQVSDKTIYNWESGQYNVSTEKFLALCEIYKIKDLSQPEEDDEESGLRISPKERKIIMAYRKNKELQYAIDKLLELD